MDFLFVQFYNNPSCHLSAPGFAENFKQWKSTGDKVVIGLPATSSTNGYVTPSKIKEVLTNVTADGVMIWEVNAADNGFLSGVKSVI